MGDGFFCEVYCLDLSYFYSIISFLRTVFISLLSDTLRFFLSFIFIDPLKLLFSNTADFYLTRSLLELVSISSSSPLGDTIIL